MRLTFTLFTLTWLSFTVSFAQNHQQFFDGADTNEWNSLFVIIENDSGNVWQIGKPQKLIFDSAATTPNAIVTDTINFYPSNNVSRFGFAYKPWVTWGVLAVRWTQKLDLDTNHDGGIVEFSIDSGTTWQNVFNNPLVYNFYGFQAENADTLESTGEFSFSGTDTLWRDIWLCFDISFLNTVTDSIHFRFTLKSDSVDNNKEGWMIDNLWSMLTIFHTVKSEMQDYIKIYPTVTNGLVNIETIKLMEYHVIESMQLFDMNGRVVQEFGISPTKFTIDIGNHPNGMYHLRINTNKATNSFPVILNK